VQPAVFSHAKRMHARLQGRLVEVTTAPKRFWHKPGTILGSLLPILWTY